MDPSDVAVEAVAVPFMPPVTARIIGRICAAGHVRISYTDEYCPLCVTRLACLKTLEEKTALEQYIIALEQRNALLSGERHMLTTKLFEMRNTMIELGHLQ